MSDYTVKHPDGSGRQIPRAAGEDDDTYGDRVRYVYSQWKLDQQPKGLTRVHLSTLDRTPPPPLLLDRLDPRESTILYGPGGAGKGSIACYWITKLVKAGLRVLILDYENHETEWARRIWSLMGDSRDRIIWSAPLAQKLGPIWGHAQAIADVVAEDEIDYIVIDSAVFACAGADPSKAEVAIEFGAALQIIGKPALSLAHVTKLHDPKYPFGSAFWHNATRVSWSLMPQEEPGTVLLTCRKANNYLKPSAQIATIDWVDGELRDVREVAHKLVTEDKIAEVLAGGIWMTPAEIVEAINDGVEEKTPGATIRSALKRGLGTRFTVNKEGKYSLRQETD